MCKKMSRPWARLGFAVTLGACSPDRDLTQPPSSAISGLDVSPDTVTLEVGMSATFTTVARDANGLDFNPKHIEWASTAPSVAAVTQSGQATAISPGSAHVSAEAEGLRVLASVTVVAHVEQLTLTPSTLTLETGGSGRFIADARDPEGNAIAGPELAWSSSDLSIADVSSDGQVKGLGIGSATIRADARGAHALAQVTVVAQRRSTQARGIAFSHSGQWRTTQFWFSGQLTVLDEFILDEVYEPAWSPNGSWLARTGTSVADSWAGIWISRFPGAGGFSVVSGEFPPSGTLAHCPVWSSDGTSILYGVGTSIRLSGVRGTPRDRTPVIVTTGSPCPALSTDGSRLAYVSGPPGKLELHVVGLKGGSDQIIASGAADNSPPAWAPDGARLVYAGFASPQAAAAGSGPGLWIVNRDGSGRVALTPSAPGTNDVQPDWSPDGGHIAFARSRNGGGIHEIGIDGTGLQQLTHGGTSDSWPRYRPRGVIP